MNRRPSIDFGVVVRSVFACLLAMAFVVSTAAQLNGQSNDDQLQQREWNRGYHGLALVCRSLDMQLHSSYRSWLRQPADERVAIILGQSLPTFILPSGIVREEGGVLIACDGSERVSLFRDQLNFNRMTGFAASDRDGYNQKNDCPIVRSVDATHPAFKGVGEIITNRPAGISTRGYLSDLQVAATFPRLVLAMEDAPFAYVTPADSGKRALLCSDPSVFSNQMITLGDNAKFAVSTLTWLKGDKETKRKHVLMVVDGEIVVPPHPGQLDIDIPAPTPNEVLDALKNLPKDKLLEVGNQLAAIVQEENLPNELLSEIARDVPAIKYQRALVFVVTTILGLFLVFRYLMSESLLQDAIGIGKNPDKQRRVEAKHRQAGERRAAAMEIVGRFYSELTAGQRSDAAAFPNGLKLKSGEKSVWKGMKRIGKNLRGKKAKWWTAARLQNLSTQLEYWNELRGNQSLVIENTT